MRIIGIVPALLCVAGCVHNSSQSGSTAPRGSIRPQAFGESTTAAPTNQSGFWLEPVHLDSSQIRQAAEAELIDSRELITPETYSGLGFTKWEDGNRAVLGQPLVCYQFDLKSLLDSKTADTNRMRFTREIVFPVEVDGQPRAALVLARYGSKWENLSFGKGSWMQRVSRIRAQQARLAGLPLSAFSLVRLAPLNLDCVVWEAGGRLMLVPAFTLRELKSQADQAQYAPEIITALLPLARQLLEQQTREGKPIVR
jgi:hypothetical protein